METIVEKVEIIEREPPDKPVPPLFADALPKKASTWELWLTALTFAAGGSVYVALLLHSLTAFVIGEACCLVLAPFSVWLARAEIHAWWKQRKKYAAAGYDILAIKRGDADRRKDR